ncbi:BppU family phage baseplate upper protein [Leuconostoc gelidum subsp. gasicomitatum]|uniref:BppU family phage baseplate upper protein n=1 Tax=Leuconostoc gasicomitatum TaxID=115778 RepID=UPI001CC48726|nr:BppU family phage baseplate upper protein [Leuconostoc gasicomitatum]MBZ5943906.1 BppU family phage baseplate upper protein [Leuconostoc gasicomitatum]MBZ5973014.1 BppU family phage baseplate upper protein [Leuconostoc gasicomitatum]
MSNQYLSFDVTKQSIPQQLITGRQGDSQLKFVTMLFWDGENNIPYDLTGKQVAFEALKPDNTHIVDYEGITILDATAGLVRYSFNEQVFSVSGTMQQAFFKITHTDSDNNVIADSTLEVAINILENRVEFGINSKNYLSEYDDLVAQVKKKFDDYATTVKDSIDKAQALHDQIVEYTEFINSMGVITKDVFGNISDLKPIGNTVVDKINNEFTNKGVNILWYGAIGDGKTDNTDSILKAYNFAKNNDTTVFVPSGLYFVKFDTLPDKKIFQGNGVIVNDGKQFNISTNINRDDIKKLQNPFAITRYTYGRYNTAAGMSVSANTEDEAAVIGINDNSTGLSAYDNRDSVALYTTNTSGGWYLTSVGVTFGADYVEVATDVDLSGVRVGMFIDTKEKPKNTGIITGIVNNRIMVNKWITFGGGDTGVTPVNGSAIVINPTTAIWGQNSVVQLNADTPIMSAVGYEMDVINNQPHRTDVNGMTLISDGTYPANAALTARKQHSGQWYYSLLSRDSEYGVYHSGGSVGYYVENPKFTAFAAHNSPTVIASQNARSSQLIHAIDPDNKELFTMYNDGKMSRFTLQRQLGKGNVSAPVVFATGDITLPSPDTYPDEIIIVTNVTNNDIKLNARISYKGKQYNPMTLHAYSSAMFICDGVEYYNTNFTDAISIN